MRKGKLAKNSMPNNRLWLYRKKMGYSQQMVAQLLGHKSPARICDYEQGKIIPSLETALKLAVILGTPIRELYFNLFGQWQQEINHQKTKLFDTNQNK